MLLPLTAGWGVEWAVEFTAKHLYNVSPRDLIDELAEDALSATWLAELAMTIIDLLGEILAGFAGGIKLEKLLGQYALGDELIRAIGKLYAKRALFAITITSLIPAILELLELYLEPEKNTNLDVPSIVGILGGIISAVARTRIRTGEMEELAEESIHEANEVREERDNGVINKRKLAEIGDERLEDVLGLSTGDKIRFVADIVFAFAAIAALKEFFVFEDEKIAILTMATINILAMLADIHQDDEISITDLLENALIGINLRQLATLTNNLPI